MLPNETPTKSPPLPAEAGVPSSPSPQELRTAAIRAYFDAETKEARLAVVKAYPFLKEVFAEVNHS